MPLRSFRRTLEHLQRRYAEAGGTVKINRVSIGAGTDAAFAALETKAPVIEGMGLRNFGADTRAKTSTAWGGQGAAGHDAGD